MFKSSRAIVALCLTALLLGSAAVPASAAAVGAAPQLVQPAAVSVPYGSGPIVIDPLDTAVKLPGQDILPGNNLNGVFDLNNAVTAYGKGETDASAIAPAFVKSLEQPGDFVGQINLIDAGADIYALHQKNRLVVVVLPYDGFSGTLKLAYAGEVVQGAQPVYTFNNVPITVTVQDPTVKAADDTVTGPLFADGAISAPNGLTAGGGSLTIPDISENDTSVFPGRNRTVFFGSKDSPQSVIGIPEGVVHMEAPFGPGATFYSYDPNFTGKVTVPYTVCSSYTINPRGYLDVGLGVNNTSTSEVCSTALLTFDIPAPVPDIPTVPVVPTTPEMPVVPTTPETPVVPVPTPENPAPVVPVPAPVVPAVPVPAPVVAAHAKLHIADGSAAVPVVAVSPAVPFPVAFGVAALVMVIYAGGLIAVGRMRRK
jgi:hypothetical protein